MAKKRSIKSRIINVLKSSGIYGWNKPGMAFFLVVGVAALCLQTYLAQTLNSIWNWILVASTAMWTLFAMYGETRSAKKERIAGNRWTSKRVRTRKIAFIVAGILLLLTVATIITDLLIINDVTSSDTVHSALASAGKWLGKAAIKCGIVLAAFIITIWVVSKFLESLIEAEAENSTSCNDVIIIMIATGFEAYYLGNHLADHLIAMM